MTLKHITRGQLGLHADSSEELATCIQRITQAGYAVTNIEDDPTEPWHVATIHYTNHNIQHVMRELRAALQG
jgi:hypothetical protein